MLAYFYIKILLFINLTALIYSLYVITFLITYFEKNILKKKSVSNKILIIFSINFYFSYTLFL